VSGSTFWAQTNFGKNSVENLCNDVNIKFFAHFDKATIKAACCEVSYQKLFFLGGSYG